MAEEKVALKPDRRLIIASVIISVAMIVGVFWFVNRPDPNAPLVLYGNVDIREVQLAFRQGGRISDMRVDEGDAVTEGQTLALLDSEPLREALTSAEADIARTLAESRAAQTNFQRQDALLRAGAISRRTWEAAKAERDTAAASLAGARARRAQAETAVADAELKSPEAGIIVSRTPEPGAMVTAGATIYTLSLSDPVYVRAYVAEPDLGRLAPGARVIVRTDSSDHAYEGQVGFISPRAEFTPRSVETPELRTDLVYRLRIIVRDADQGLRQGMPVTIEAPLAQSVARTEAQNPSQTEP